jgi:hypothetical protein
MNAKREELLFALALAENFSWPPRLQKSAVQTEAAESATGAKRSR